RNRASAERSRERQKQAEAALRARVEELRAQIAATQDQRDELRASTEWLRELERRHEPPETKLGRVYRRAVAVYRELYEGQLEVDEVVREARAFIDEALGK
ncbi:hypothetical protein H4R18_002501, partial [Coemansia javaensis]